MGFTILGTGSALPERSVSNDELSEFLDTSDEWIFTRTGIKSRHVCTTESLDDLAVAASERALQVSGIDASQLDLIVCSTTTGDHLVPAEACAVAEHREPILYLHHMNKIDNHPTININEFFRIDPFHHLLQTRAFQRYALGGNKAHIFAFTCHVNNIFVQQFFQTVRRLNDITAPIFQ